MKITYDPNDDISVDLLYKHYYMLEMGEMLYDISTKDSMYDQLEFPVDKIEQGIRNKYPEITSNQLSIICNNLVVTGYFSLESRDNRKTMFHKLTPRGMAAISGATFLRELEGRQRDLLQARLADSQITFSRRSLQIAGLTMFFIAITAVLQYRDKTAQRVQELQQIMTTQSQAIKEIRTSLEEINSSIEKSKIDSLSVRLKK
jgi:hypothetical protein